MRSYRYFWALIYILTVALAAFAGSTATGAPIEDDMLSARVKSALIREPELKSGEISVGTFEGDVQLSGFVSKQADIDRAMEIARNTAGVKTVRNDMHLR